MYYLCLILSVFDFLVCFSRCNYLLTLVRNQKQRTPIPLYGFLCENPQNFTHTLTKSKKGIKGRNTNQYFLPAFSMDVVDAVTEAQ